jgi:hypothetical protein
MQVLSALMSLWILRVDPRCLFEPAGFHDEFVGGFGGGAEYFDIGIFLAAVPAQQILDPVDAQDGILWEVSIVFKLTYVFLICTE